ncbi:MAG: FtsH protease activity modulator HflK [Gammaproteobacteria bacterium]|nr:FtsH protease activity modulator HflK [Gammaproteobacteria bacterium]
MAVIDLKNTNDGAKANGWQPGGSPEGNNGPPDLEELFRQQKKNVENLFGGKRGRKKSGGGGNSGNGSGNGSGGSSPKRVGGLGPLLGLAVLLGIVWLIYTAYYTVPSDSVGLVTRFGKYLKEEPAGLHFKVPWGADEVVIVPVKRQLKQEFGFSTRGATNSDQTRPNPQAQSQMVTGDLNAALVEWVVQYRIEDPKKYMFDVRNPGETLRDLSESVMREVVGDRTVDEVITIGRQEIENEALVKMQELTTKYGIGVSIDQVQLKNINPPRPVQESFNEVNQAQQEKESLINAARREYNKVVPLAEGEKDQRIRAADGYRLKRINEAEGDAARFNAVLTEYLKAPEVTRRRIYIETLEEVLPGLESKIIMDEQSQQVLPLLPLGGKGLPK